MIIKKQRRAWHSMGFRTIQPINELLTYHTIFSIGYIIIGCVLTYLNYASINIKYKSRS